MNKWLLTMLLFLSTIWIACLCEGYFYLCSICTLVMSLWQMAVNAKPDWGAKSRIIWKQLQLTKLVKWFFITTVIVAKTLFSNGYYEEEVNLRYKLYRSLQQTKPVHSGITINFDEFMEYYLNPVLLSSTSANVVLFLQDKVCFIVVKVVIVIAILTQLKFI